MLTDDTVAVKLAVVVPAATVTVAGTVTAELLLARFTAKPPLSAAALSVTVQLSVPAPVMEPLVQFNELNTAGLAATPVPLSPTTSVPFTAASLEIVSAPVAAPIAAGEKLTLRLSVPPAATVIGRLLPPLTENDCPAKPICETLTAADP